MNRRKLLVVLAGLAVLAVGAFILWPRPDRITRENYERIQGGMTRAEVEAILGPPGTYITRPTVYDSGKDEIFGPEIEPPALWDADDASITIFFGPSGGLALKRYDGGTEIEQSALDNLLWRAKRQWRRWFPE